MYSLIIKAILVAAVLGALYKVVQAVNLEVMHHYVDPVRVEMQAVTDKEKKRADDAESLNKDLSGINDQNGKDIGACNRSVATITTQRDMAMRISEELVKQAKKHSEATSGLIASLRAQAAGPPTTGEFCEQAKEADKVLSDFARAQRLRDKQP